MFDDEKTPGQAPGNLPFAPEPHPIAPPGSAGMSTPVAAHGPDALDAGLLKRKGDSAGIEEPPMVSTSSPFTAPLPPPQPMAAMTYATKEPVLGKILAGILSIVAIGALGLGGWYAYTRIVRPMLDGTQNGAQNIPNSSVSTTPTSTASTSLPVYRPQTSSSSIEAQTNNDTILFGEQTDTDRDGLSDRRERELGTDPEKADTDGDGLSDGDEILIWATDPLNPDSDGDGYKDGSEVKNGYSPLGPGKLFDAPTSTASSSTSPQATVNATSSVSTTPTSSPNNVPSL